MKSRDFSVTAILSEDADDCGRRSRRLVDQGAVFSISIRYFEEDKFTKHVPIETLRNTAL
jgi:hypothetical protein